MVYPSICNAAFEMLNCTPLSADLAVLSVDYTTECNTGLWNFHATVAVFLIVGFAFGIPMRILWQMTNLRDSLSLPKFRVCGDSLDAESDISNRRDRFYMSRRVSEEMACSNVDGWGREQCSNPPPESMRVLPSLTLS